MEKRPNRADYQNTKEYIHDYVIWSKKQESWKKDKERLHELVKSYYNKKIENIAKGKHPEIKVKEFTEVPITKYALKKGNYISRRINELGKRPLEIYMYLTNKISNYQKNRYLIDDIYIARTQDVTASTCDVRGKGNIESRNDINQNLKSRIVGWSHSQGNNMAFHSNVDNNNLQMMTSQGTKKKVELIQSKSFDASCKVNFDYVPSIVFNAYNHDPFIAIAVKYPQFTKEGTIYKTHINYKCGVDLLNLNEKRELDTKLIDAQILDNVFYNGNKLSDIYTNGNAKLKQQLLKPLSRLAKISSKILTRNNHHHLQKIREMHEKYKKNQKSNRSWGGK